MELSVNLLEYLWSFTDRYTSYKVAHKGKHNDP